MSRPWRPAGGGGRPQLAQVTNMPTQAALNVQTNTTPFHGSTHLVYPTGYRRHIVYP